MEIIRKKDADGVRIAEHNRILFWIIMGLLVILAVILIYIKVAGNENKVEIQEDIEMANPASVYCVDNEGQLDIRTSEDGSQYGICILKNGTECDEWKYYRGEC